MTGKLPAVQQALEHAHEHSTRPGKWSTVPDVRNFEDNTTLSTLRRLVKEGSASEKIKNGMPLKLFKPTRSGAGATGLEGKEDGKNRDQDRGKDQGRRKGKGDRKGKENRKGKGDRKGKRSGKPRGNKPEKTDKNPKDWKKDKPGDTVKNTISTGIATLMVGGMGSAMGGAGEVTKVGALPTVRM